MAIINSSPNAIFDEANLAVSIVSPIIFRIMIAILIFLLGFIIGKIIQKFILKLFEISDLDRVLKKLFRIRFNASKVVAAIALYLIYILAIIMALNSLGLTTTIVTTIVILLIIILVLFIIFGLNDVFANMFAGMLVRFRKNIKPGDYIRIKDKHIEGYVASINMLNVRIETLKEEVVLVPNMVLFKSEIIKPKKHPGKKSKK